MAVNAGRGREWARPGLNRLDQKTRFALIIAALVLLLLALALIFSSAEHGAPGRVVENYLTSASQGDGAGMYGLLATSERTKSTPEALQNVARNRYNDEAEWEILKVDERNGVADVIVALRNTQMGLDPHRFTLSREGGEWRIIQSPEMKAIQTGLSPASGKETVITDPGAIILRDKD